MKKYTILILILISIYYQKVECRLAPSLNYNYFDKTNDIILAIDLKSTFYLGGVGAYDELTLLKLSAGERFQSNKNSIIYDLGLVSYQTIIRIPILKDKSNKDFNSEVVYDLPKEYSTFLTFSYQGLSFKNTGIYNKEINWSSIGVDLLYKKFQKTHLYTKLSFIASASTIENNRNYFSDIDSAYKREFCFSTKVSSFSKLLLTDFSAVRLEAYYRNFYNDLNQKEIACSLGYEFDFSRFIVNTQIGYTIYGVTNKWKDFGSVNIGLTYVIVKDNTIY